MVIVNKITPPKTFLYSPENELLGEINEYEFLDVRVQIKNNQLEGYYCIHNGEKLLIDKNGRIANWPIGFFDILETFYMNLL